MSEIPNTDKSRIYFEMAKELFVGGVASSLHKTEYDEYPIYIESGKGSKVYDVDGNEYIDYLGGFGPMVLGYAPPQVGKAVKEQIDKGSLFAAPTQSLNEVSKKLIEHIPCADLITYQNTGTEANMLAFRLARAYTGKEKILRFEGHYHGWSDEEMISIAADSPGMLGSRHTPWKVLASVGQLQTATQHVIVLPWNDVKLLEKTIMRNKNDIAAVITEPVMCNCEVVFPAPGFLESLRELTAQNEILLIFDEVITGFRLSLGGAQEFYNITPDIGVFGKAMAGGYPLAAIAGNKAIMESGVKPRGTFNANPISIAACKATVEELEKPGIYERMAKLTQLLVAGINDMVKKRNIPLYCDSVGSIWQIAFGIIERMNDYRDNFRVDKATYQKFRKRCLAKGLRLHPSRGRFYTSAAHTEDDIDKTLKILEEVLIEMSPGK
jgi:glutamate-1-semialdehyde 2,1-aminomutase